MRNKPARLARFLNHKNAIIFNTHVQFKTESAQCIITNFYKKLELDMLNLDFPSEQRPVLTKPEKTDDHANNLCYRNAKTSIQELNHMVHGQRSTKGNNYLAYSGSNKT